MFSVVVLLSLKLCRTKESVILQCISCSDGSVLCPVIKETLRFLRKLGQCLCGAASQTSSEISSESPQTLMTAAG